MARPYRVCDNYIGRICMPYCFLKLDVPERGEHVYLPLNRNYKPLGMSQSKWVDYYDYTHQCVSFRKDPAKIAGHPWVLIKPIGWRNDGPFLFLYDTAASCADYGKRLQLVMQETR
jgi:hypothetical protein